MKDPEYIYPQKMLPFWLGICAALILLIVYIVTQSWVFALLAAYALIFSLIINLIIKKWRVEIFDEKIVIRGPLDFREFLWEEIRLTFVTGKLSYNLSIYYWFFEDYTQSRFGFDVNFFTRSQLKKIALVVIQKCPKDVIDIKIWNISEGKFPFYIL